MPFTFSHPAVILPFRFVGRKYFSITGLVVGSVIPDFEYFIRIENRSHYSHTFPGIFWFDLPLGLLVCFLFHNIVRNPFIANSPYPLHTRLARFYEFNWNRFFKQNWFIVICSVILGIFTHIVADKLTHKSSNLVSEVPGLVENQDFVDAPKSIYRVIQITFSSIGLALCALTVWQLPKYKILNDYNPNNRYWLLMLCIFAVVLISIIARIGYPQSDLIVSTMSAMLSALLLTSLILQPDKKLLLSNPR